MLNKISLGVIYLNNFDKIKELWDEGAKFTFDDLEILSDTIDKILFKLNAANGFKIERVNDLLKLLQILKKLCVNNIEEISLPNNIQKIIEKYIHVTEDFNLMSNFEQFGLLKMVIQNIIYDLSGKKNHI